MIWHIDEKLFKDWGQSRTQATVILASRIIHLLFCKEFISPICLNNKLGKMHLLLLLLEMYKPCFVHFTRLYTFEWDISNVDSDAL